MNGVGDDGGYVRFHAPLLGSGFRRKDGDEVDERCRGRWGLREVPRPAPGFRPAPERRR